MGIQRRDQHQRLIEQLGDALAVRFNTGRAVLIKLSIPSASRRTDCMGNYESPLTIDVEFEVAGCPADIDRYIIAHDLAAQHRQRFALRGVNLCQA